MRSKKALYFMNKVNKSSIWKSLDAHAQSVNLSLPKNSVQSATTRIKQNTSSCHINLDYSHQHITDDILELLIALANTCQLREKIHGLMRGDIVNNSENRPALHTALRAPADTSIWVDGQNIMDEIIATRGKMQAIAEQIRNKNWFGYSGKPITDIVNIGIGGSDLGPRFCIDALAEHATSDLKYHFISDVDPNSFKQVASQLKPDTTLFIVSSKSFTTQETLYNARKAMAWIGEQQRHQQHFIAVTANIEKAQQFGIQNTLPIWSWVGGRYSFCSAVNLITAIAIGYDKFNQILAGANSMDKHFHDCEFSSNLPVLLGLIGIWNNNFLNTHNLLLLTYALQLKQFVPYIQQLDMESNGKSIDKQGNAVNHATGPLIWGGLGNQAQHSYYQLLCQGTHKVTVDFISLHAFADEIINDMCHAKINTLSNGINDQTNLNGFIPGNIALNHLSIQDVSPFTIGALVALYEHKIFTQSVIWDINPFDQPGVESAKRNITRNKTAERSASMA